MEKEDLSRWKSMPLLESFKQDEKILILAPHPDDEAIACAGVIQEAVKAGAKVRIVYLTNGDHNEFAFIVYEKRITMRQNEFIHMGKVRQQESVKAMKFLGVPESELIFLGYPDYGTFEIFCKYWQAQKPFRDRLTRISSVPYPNSPSYQAAYYGENILKDLTKQILDYQPDKIFVSHPADVNVDHKTLYLFTQVALSDLEGRIPIPKIYPYLVHYVGWPKPRHYHPELELYPPYKFIDSDLSWQRLNLNFYELDKKHQTILFYKSQTESSAFYLFSFARENELFGNYQEQEVSYFDSSDEPGEVQSFADQSLVETKTEKSFVSYIVQNDNIIVRLDSSHKLSKGFRIMLYVFGYSKDTAFSLMPKIRIITSGNKFKVFSAKKQITDSGVKVNLNEKNLILKIPLKFLGYPDYLLTSLKAYHGDLPADAIGYHKIRIK